MVRAKKKASGPAPDFVKAKQKVGGRKVAPANETRTTFRSQRINVPAQLQQRRPSRVPDSAPTIDLNIAGLLSKTRHHNARERRQALEHLGRVVERMSGDVAAAAPITNIVRVASRLTLDDDRGVRRALHAVLRRADFGLVAPFAADQLNRFVLAAMTHPSIAVRMDGIAALDVIVDVAATSTTLTLRQQYLSALIAALSERTETDALALGQGGVSTALRCCLALLSPAPETLDPNPNPIPNCCRRLALLHTPDPFRSGRSPRPPLPVDLLEQMAASLIECAIESAGQNAACLSACVQGLFVCVGAPLSATLCDRLRDHILPLFEAPFADADLKLQICRLAAALLGSLREPMLGFLARSFADDDLVLPCQILLLHDRPPSALGDAFVDALDSMTPSSLALDVCQRFFAQWDLGIRQRVLGVIIRRFIPIRALSSVAASLLLDGVRLHATPVDPVALLQHDLLGAVAPADQMRIAALFGYVRVAPGDLPSLAATLCDSAVDVSARSLLLDLVLLQMPPITALLSLLVTTAARADSDELLSEVAAAVSRLDVDHTGTCSAMFDAIVRLLPSVGDDHDAVRRLVTLASVCIPSASGPERLVPYMWRVWQDGLSYAVCTTILLAADAMPLATLQFLQRNGCGSEAFTALLASDALRRCWAPYRDLVESILLSVRPSLTNVQRQYVDAEMALIFGLS